MSARREENVPSAWGAHGAACATHRGSPVSPTPRGQQGTEREVLPGWQILSLLPVGTAPTAVGNPSPKRRDSPLQKFPHPAPSWFGGGFCSVNFCSCFLGSQARSFCPSSTNNSQRNLSFCCVWTCSLRRFTTF